MTHHVQKQRLCIAEAVHTGHFTSMTYVPSGCIFGVALGEVFLT